MYNVIFIDDEEESRNRVKDIEYFGEEDFCLKEVFENGFQALDYISAPDSEVDLVITDISMPYIDGVELSKRIYELFPSIKVIFLSGYDKIDYAKCAIKYGVIEYLTKPIGKDQFRQALHKVRMILDQQKEKDTSEESLREYAEKSMPVLRENTLLNLISKKFNSTFFKNRASFLKLNFCFPYFALGIIKLNHIISDKDDASSLSLDDMLFYVHKYVDEASNDYKMTIDSTFIDDKVAILFKLNDSKDLLTTAERLFESVNMKTKRYFNENIIVGISNVTSSISDIRNIYLQAQHALFQKGLVEDDYIKFYSENATDDLDILVDEYELSSFQYAIKYGSYEDSCAKLRDILFSNKKNNSLNEYYYLSTNILNVILDSSSSIHNVFAHYLPDTIYGIVMKTIDKKELFELFKELIKFVQEDNNSLRMKHVSSSLKIIVDYVDANYKNVDLSLNYLAEKAGYSTSYICMIFKKELNTTFIKYLTQLRMEKAKDLLANSNMLIIDICNKCGFSEPYYFSSTFKKYTGLSPRAYRDKIAK